MRRRYAHPRASDVVALRLTNLPAGGFDALAEAERMVSGKAVALRETVPSLRTGATPAVPVARCRERVTADAARLRTAPETR